MSKQTPRRYGGGWWIKVEDYEADIAALKAQLAGKAHNHCAYCGCVTHRRLKAEIARLRDALDDLVAWTGTAKDADHWLAKMDYANGVAKALEATK